jgi:hypothetical protein
VTRSDASAAVVIKKNMRATRFFMFLVIFVSLWENKDEQGRGGRSSHGKQGGWANTERGVAKCAVQFEETVDIYGDIVETHRALSGSEWTTGPCL